MASLLASCGFQPRGVVTQWTFSEPVKIVGVANYSTLYKTMARQLQRTGVQLVEDSAGAAILRIRGQRSGSRLLTVDSRNDAAENELEESFQFTLRHPERGDLLPEQTLRVVRILLRPQDEVLSQDREEERLRNEMHRELVNQMIRRLATVQ
mgnify:CR=1 FL=1